MNTIIVKYKRKETKVNYDIVIHNNKQYYYLGNNIVIEKLSKRTKIIELTNIITSGNKYIPLNCYYDIIKLYNSHFYKYVNKFLLNDKKFMENKKLGYYGIRIKLDIKNAINIELKKIDKAFIETGIRNNDNKVYYGILSDGRKFTTLYKSINLAKKCKGKVYKVILSEGLPYFNINRNIILLPRNILFEVIANDTLLAKEKYPSKPLCHITADFYNFKTFVKGGILSYERVALGKTEGINGLLTHDVMSVNGNTNLKFIMTNGEYHGLQTHCNKNYISEYVELFDLNENDKNYNFKIDLFLEVENMHKSVTDKFLLNEMWLGLLINKFKKNWICHEHLYCEYKKYLRVHWCDPFYDLGEGYEWLTMIAYEYKYEYYYQYETSEVLTLNELKTKYPSIFENIKSKDDLIKIILENRLVRKQGEKVNKKIIPDWIQFVKDVYYNDLVLDITENNWYIYGIFKTNRICMDFYTIFRMLKDSLNIQNAIYHSGKQHTIRFNIMLKKLNFKVESLAYKNLDSTRSFKCLDVNFKFFLNKILEEEEYKKLKEEFYLQISIIESISDISEMSSSLEPYGLSDLSSRSGVLSPNEGNLSFKGPSYLLNIFLKDKNLHRDIIIKQKLQAIIDTELLIKQYNDERKLEIIKELKTLDLLNSREIRYLHRRIKKQKEELILQNINNFTNIKKF